MSPRISGKKVGKFAVVTVLARYDLDVRLDLQTNVFIIVVPNSPDGELITKEGQRSYESFKAPTLDVVKAEVEKFLKERDVTDFVDVIEYNYSGTKEAAHWGSAQNTVGFDFRVARVSIALDRSQRPKLEIPVDIDDSGNITVSDFFGKACSPQAYRHRHDARLPFSVDRWRKCCAISDGIKTLDRLLFELLGKDGDEGAAKLDAVANGSLLQLTAAMPPATGDPPDDVP